MLAGDGARAGSGPLCVWLGAGRREPQGTLQPSSMHPMSALSPEGTASPILALQVLMCCEGSRFQFALERTVLNLFLPPMKILFSRHREGKK